MRPILVDLAAAPPEACDCALDELFKAMSVGPTTSPAIWRRHENPYLAPLVEDVTRRGQAIALAAQDHLAELLTGDAMGALQKAALPGLDWSPEHLAQVKFHLETLPPSQWTLDDYMLAADYIIQRYLPAGAIQTEADYLTVRATLLGKIEAQMEPSRARAARFNAEQAEALAQLLPASWRGVPPRVLNPVEMRVLEFARANAAQHMTATTDQLRNRIKGVILQHVQAMVFGQREGTTARLQTALFDSFGQFNRDWRRVAVTETGEASGQGYVAAQPVGARLRRVEAYEGACDWCRSIDGKVFTVVAPNDPNRNGDTQVWVGKTNVGRSAAPRKRTPDGLVEREPEEMWWPAAGAQHPHCRGGWQMVRDDPRQPPPGVSREFATWLDDAIKASRRPAPA